MVTDHDARRHRIDAGKAPFEAQAAELDKAQPATTWAASFTKLRASLVKYSHDLSEYMGSRFAEERTFLRDEQNEELKLLRKAYAQHQSILARQVRDEVRADVVRLELQVESLATEIERLRQQMENGKLRAIK